MAYNLDTYWKSAAIAIAGAMLSAPIYTADAAETEEQVAVILNGDTSREKAKGSNMASWQWSERNLRIAYNTLINEEGFDADDIIIFNPRELISKTGFGLDVIEPTAANFYSEMEELQNLGQEDRLLVYITGHGVGDYLRFGNTLLPMENIVEYIEAVPAEEIVIMTDMCHSELLDYVQDPRIKVETSPLDRNGETPQGRWADGFWNPSTEADLNNDGRYSLEERAASGIKSIIWYDEQRTDWSFNSLEVPEVVEHSFLYEL